MPRPVGQLSIGEIQRVVGELMLTVESQRLRMAEMEQPISEPKVIDVKANHREPLKK